MLNRLKRSSYSGTNAYKEVERLIKKGREVLIVSPYLDRYYARFLLNNSRGKEISIIASSLDSETEKLLRKGVLPLQIVLLAIFSLALDYLLFQYGVLHYAGIALSVLIILVLLLALASIKPQNIRLKVPKSFVHAKMYIADNRAIAGSANLTYKGMHRNIEHIEIIESEDEVSRLRKQFWEIWRKV